MVLLELKIQVTLHMVHTVNMACDHIHLKIYTVYKFTHDHDDSFVFEKNKSLQVWHMIV